jgi:hypothetical protein
VQRIASDPFSNVPAQHATVVEPAAFAVGTTIVAAYQAGRYPTYGASDIGYATSTNGGATWTAGTLPGLTTIVSPQAQFDGASDPAVAYDAAHGTWLISSVPITTQPLGPAALVSSSSNGFIWSEPSAVASAQQGSDKPWVACDDSAASPYYGHCYVAWDESAAGGLVHVSTSVDGGATWSAPRNPPNGVATGIGAQPLVRPDGTLVVTYDDWGEQNVVAFASRDGGATFSAPVLVANILAHRVLDLRAPPFPSAQVDGTGTLYVVWQDCRYRTNCGANDLLLVTSPDGTAWSVPVRVPIDSLASPADHFIPGLGVDAAASGAVHLVLSYYAYSDTACRGGCSLFAAAVVSPDGGASWSVPVTIGGPMQTGWLPNTDNGPMVGDYSASVFSAHAPIGFFAVGQAPGALAFDEALYATIPGALSSGGARSRARAERPVSTRADRPQHPIR